MKTYMGFKIEQVRDALKMVADEMRRGTIGPERFNMQSMCGTVCCIGGHAAAKLWKDREAADQDALKPFRYSKDYRKSEVHFREHEKPKKFQAAFVRNSAELGIGLHNLFYPNDLGGKHHWRDITPAQASCAITNYLEYDDPKWHAVVAK